MEAAAEVEAAAVVAAAPAPAHGNLDTEATCVAAQSTSCKERLGDLESRLQAARRVAGQRKRRVQVPCLLVGASMTVVSLVLRMLGAHGVLPPESACFLYLPLGLSIISFLLALLPTQRQHIRCANVVVILVGTAIILLSSPAELQNCLQWMQEAGGALPPWYAWALASVTVVLNLGRACVVANFARLLFLQLPPRLHLDALWAGMRRMFSFFACIFGALFLLEASNLAEGSWGHLLHLTEAATFASLAALSASPRLRVRVQAFLAERHSSTTAAMAVGVLLSSRPLEQVLSLARKRFRCVPLDRVTRAMVADNKPNPELLEHTEHTMLGAVDAFVSHSWHDDADAKWEALQEWRAEFKEAMGREPRVWFDKFCIDQANITDSLVGLPIYLAGCDKLLILHGETYQRRLWCLLEIFTFIVMGGSVHNLVVRQLRTCESDFAGFDARSATCFKTEDSSHLLSVIETGLGTIDKFNSEVRAMVGRQCSSHSLAVTGSTSSCGSASGRAVVYEDEDTFRI